MSNHLKHETSPYLLQHAENPVNWYPWCGEAFEKARREDKPIFLSVGYSTCHWCHVMARESFENKETAAVLNRYFISVKVDREERPDVDSVYMSVCQAFTGSGGWPMSIFMTWDKKPFFAGTYFPVHARYGMPGFSDVLHAVAEQWKDGREALMHSAAQVIAHLKQSQSGQKSGNGANLSENAVKALAESFDSKYGGFGAAPKFPMPHNLLFLAHYAQVTDEPGLLEMVEKTLIQMRKGGIFDQIGGGFSRYSTDRYFLAPHFEKMLYDNALLIIVYAAVYGVVRKQEYLDTAIKTAEYVLGEMTSSCGGFFSAQDADSEGEEGRYYTFTLEEILDVLGEEKGRRFSNAFDITADGNFEGANIPNLLKNHGENPDFKEELGKLYAYRKNRRKLHLDDKILVSWNSMMIAALAALYRACGKEKYLQAAVKAQAFIENNLCDGRFLSASWRDHRRSEKGFLDDYAFYTAALTELYHSTLEGAYLEKAQSFCREAVKRFADHKRGGFFLSDSEDAELFMNPKETYDGAVPSGNSVMAYNFIRLYQLTGKEEYRAYADRQIAYMSAQAREYPAGHSMFLFAKLVNDYPPEHIRIVLKDDRELEKIKRKLPLLANVTVASESREYPLINGKATFYVCKNHICLTPSNTFP